MYCLLMTVCTLAFVALLFIYPPAAVVVGGIDLLSMWEVANGR